MVRRSAKRRLGCASGLALLVALHLPTPDVMAAGGAGFRLDDSAGLVIAMSAIDLLNLGTLIVNAAYLGDSEMPTKVAVLSYIGGAAGLVAGGLGATSDEGGVKALAAVTFGAAALTIGLTTWNITRPKQEQLQPDFTMTPSAIVDSEGDTVPAAAVMGVF